MLPTTPHLDFQLFKTLITASSSKEHPRSINLDHSVIPKRSVAPLCFWNKAIIYSPELSGTTERSPQMTRAAQQEAIQGPLSNCWAKSQLLWQLSTVFYIATVLYDSSNWVLCRGLVALDLLYGFFPCDWWVKVCSCHIFHKEKISRYILPRDWNSVQLFDCCATRSPSLLLCSALESRWFLCKTQQTQHFRCFFFFFDWEMFPGSLTPPHRSSWCLQISFTLWERTACVYFSVCIRQWRSLRPARSLLLDKETSKASLFRAGAPHEDTVWSVA